mmetsp:Transcript_102883/g.314757  ORF Transcript_102883/g.314757 Transcript_102883/m.314757 type:complete len:296 (-) Transcript_102883:62-949(-)
MVAKEAVVSPDGGVSVLAVAPAKAKRRTLRDLSGEPIIFDARGRIFKVLPSLILSQPDTLLSQLVEDVGTDISRPIFVDVNGDRFEHFLDWYRYGEMFPPQGTPVAAILRDAAYLLLPDAVVVNGVSHAVIAGDVATRRTVAQDIHQSFVADVVKRWPGFDNFLQEHLDDIRAYFQHRSGTSDKRSEKPEYNADSRFEKRLLIFSCGWRFPEHIFNMDRARAFVAKLQQCGFECEISFANHPDVFISVSLPTVAVAGQQSVSLSQPLSVKTICPHAGCWICPGSKCPSGAHDCRA